MEESKILDERMRRIIIHGIRPKFEAFITAVQGWQTQPTVDELENLLIDQEAQGKQAIEGAQKTEEEALFSGRGRGRGKYSTREGLYNTRGGSKGKGRSQSIKGHFARDYRYKKGSVQGNVATSKEEGNHSDKEWDMHASCATLEIDTEVEANQVALLASNQSRVDYSKNWIIDSGAASHITRDEEKLLNLSEYKGNRVVVTADDTQLPIKQIGDVVITPRTSSQQVKVKNVLHVSRMKKNLLSVAQLTAPKNYVVFRLKDVKVMMNKSMVKGLPKLEVHKDAVCARCQYGKAHQLPYQDSKFKAKEPLQLVHSDVFGKVKQSSIGGAQYMVTFTDDYSRLPQATLGFISPFEKLWNIKPVSDAFFLAMMIKGKDGGAVTQILGIVVFLEMLCLMKHLLGGLHNRMLDTQEVVEKEKEITPKRIVSPWQTGVREPMTEETRQGEVEKAKQQHEQQLRHSTRERKPNPKVKTWPDGKIERYKASLVARGFSQQYGIDYDETYNLIPKITTVRVLLALATSKSMKMWQMDLKNAFLHGEIDREIYMEQPCGFEDKRHLEYVCKLKKALYGLK
ncbi:hypothetical protein SLEP1_g4499 [Rubroshorea leprosula]|uniref:Reverse transcriptase Ty1/copia-type domain-containing protein n=1 Tax=Rubroshorea leprosula TaxID=152421 RepID=A0AAV5HUP0_9ROSI|nr:hypothetical protein SLEP1_g4499 [Rubroshorea leprosula]